MHTEFVRDHIRILRSGGLCLFVAFAVAGCQDYDSGWNAGYRKGKDEGHSAGYREGYSAGTKLLVQDYALPSLGGAFLIVYVVCIALLVYKLLINPYRRLLNQLQSRRELWVKRKRVQKAKAEQKHLHEARAKVEIARRVAAACRGIADERVRMALEELEQKKVEEVLAGVCDEVASTVRAVDEARTFIDTDKQLSVQKKNVLYEALISALTNE